MGSAATSSETNTGIQLLDSEHREQLEIIAEIQEVLAYNQNIRQIALLLRQLEQLNLAHYEFEEDMMVVSRYPGVAAHSREHVLMTERLRRLVSLRTQCALPSFRESLDLFSQCFVSHLQVDDMNYGLWMNR